MTWNQFLIDHYTERLGESKSFKEKQFLNQTLTGIKTNPNEHNNPDLPFRLINTDSRIPHHRQPSFD